MTPGGGAVFIESNTSGTGRMFVDRMRTLVERVTMLTAEPEKYPWLETDGVEVVECDTRRVEPVLAEVRRLDSTGGLRTVLTSSDVFTPLAASVARALGLPGPERAVVDRCRDKLDTSTLLRRRNLDVPESVGCDGVDDVIAATTALGPPVIVKPRVGTGGLGVRLCRTVEEAAAHAAGCAEEAAGGPEGPPILVQEYVAGSEHSVELFDGRPVCVVDKHVTDGSFPVEVGHDIPEVPPGIHSALARAAGRAACEIGADWGPVHVEIRADADRFAVIEVNHRLAGGMIPVAVAAANGLDLIDATCRRALGEVVELAAPARRAAAIRFLVADEPVRRPRLSGVEKAMAVDHVVGVWDLVTRGREIVGPPRSFRDRAAVVVTGAPTLDVATAAAESAIARLALHEETAR